MKRVARNVLLALGVVLGLGIVGAGLFLSTSDYAPAPISPGIPSFPWPPPPASAEFEIPPTWLPRSPTQLSDVAQELVLALGAAQYPKWSFSSVPNGFALVAQMEQIKADGTPSPAPARWSTDLPRARELSLFAFIRALASAPQGFYRVIVFIVTDEPWSRAGERPTGKEAERWLAEGYNRLPIDIGELTYREGHHATTALVYEFEKRFPHEPAAQIENSDILGKDHLQKAGILGPLSGAR